MLHAKVAACYKEYLSKHRPVLLRNLGARAREDVTFTAKRFGPGAESCFTLFPGWWTQDSSHTFVARTFKKVPPYLAKACFARGSSAPSSENLF